MQPNLRIHATLPPRQMLLKRERSKRHHNRGDCDKFCDFQVNTPSLISGFHEIVVDMNLARKVLGNFK